MLAAEHLPPCFIQRAFRVFCTVHRGNNGEFFRRNQQVFRHAVRLLEIHARQRDAGMIERHIAAGQTERRRFAGFDDAGFIRIQRLAKLAGDAVPGFRNGLIHPRKITVHRVPRHVHHRAAAAFAERKPPRFCRPAADAAAAVNQRCAVRRDMAEGRTEAEDVFAPIDAAAAAFCGELRHLVEVAENVARAVNVADAAQNIPVIQLAVDQVAHHAFRRRGHFIRLVVEAVGFCMAVDKLFFQECTILRIEAVIRMEVDHFGDDRLEAVVPAHFFEDFAQDVDGAHRIDALLLVIGGVKMEARHCDFRAAESRSSTCMDDKAALAAFAAGRSHSDRDGQLGIRRIDFGADQPGCAGLHLGQADFLPAVNFDFSARGMAE